MYQYRELFAVQLGLNSFVDRVMALRRNVTSQRAPA
jgi:hypothetical protein